MFVEITAGSPRRILLLVLLALLMPVSAANAQERLQFINDGSDSDKHLQSYLQDKAKIYLQSQTWTYNNAVRQVADWKISDRYLAHMTPYACVAAEMLGANFEILATYHSAATDDTIYHGYFVVNKLDYDKNVTESHGPPTLNDLATYLEKRKKANAGQPPPTFLYHEKVSTSSFFLPSLYFRSQRVFAITESGSGPPKSILVAKAPPGADSKFLVGEVAAGRAQLAAVWDKTIKDTEKDGEKDAQKDYKDKVYFVALPTDIPNDLLVLSKPPEGQGPDSVRGRIVNAIRDTAADKDKWNLYKEDRKKGAKKDESKKDDDNKEKEKEEFQYWVYIEDEAASNALYALGELRRLAAPEPHYVTVQVNWANTQKGQSASSTASTDRTKLLAAVEDGVRLSGTEFVPYDRSFHKNIDVVWTLQSIHDKALSLTSQIGESDVVKPQQFFITFMDVGDLTNRIAGLVQTRMHRIRYIWPYQENYPAVIRDLEFIPEELVSVQRIIWTDQERNDYEGGVPFEALVLNTDDLHKLRLSEASFPKGPDGRFLFEPMSNVAYRVILRRPSTEAPWLTSLTGLFVGLLGLAAIACALELRRKRPPPAGFVQTHQRLVEKYHEQWQGRQIREADILWCDGPRIDGLVEQLRNGSRLPEEIQKTKLPWIPLSLGTLQTMYQQALGYRLVKCSEAGSTEAIERLLKFLMHSHRLSPFAGRPFEWEALEEIAERNFRRLSIGLSDRAVHLNRDGALATIVSRHFQEVLDRGRKVSLFHHRWELQETEKTYKLTHKEDLGGRLRLFVREGEIFCGSLLLEIEIPKSTANGSGATTFAEILNACGADAWILGRIAEGQVSYVPHNGTGILTVPLEAFAVLKQASTPEPTPLALAKGAV